MAARGESWVGLELSGGRYRIDALLGEGGMGFVYRAHDGNLDTDVVIKVPRRALLDDPDFAHRFAREIRALVQLVHPHIVKIIDAGEHDGLPYAVMQHLAGGSLEDLRVPKLDGRADPLPPATLNDWLLVIAKALDFVHSRGIVHRDVKPGNVLFDQHGNAYLSDFGIAKTLAGTAGSSRNATMTSAGNVVGTPEYMAFELVMGYPYDGRADQYALAVTIYELLAGRRPFEETGTAVMVRLGQAEGPPELHVVCPTAPESLARALQRGLSRDPAARYPTCGALASAVLAEVKAVAPTHKMPVASIAPATRCVEAVTAGAPPTAGQTILPCPSCGALMRVPESARGRRGRCSGCNARYRVADDLTVLEPVAEATPESGSLPHPLGITITDPSSALTTTKKRSDTGSQPAAAPDGAGTPQSGSDQPAMNLTGADRMLRRRALWIGSAIAAGTLVAGILLGAFVFRSGGQVELKSTVAPTSLDESVEAGPATPTVTKAPGRPPSGPPPKYAPDWSTASRSGNDSAPGDPFGAPSGPDVDTRSSAVIGRSHGPEANRFRDTGGVLVQREVALFNKKDLDGWTVFRLNRPAPNWTNLVPERDQLYCPPGSDGRLQTNQSYRNFLLLLEYCLPADGVVSDKQSGIVLVPAGDLSGGFRVLGSPVDRVSYRIKPRESGNLELTQARNRQLVPRTAGIERPAGEWNEIAIQVDGRSVKCFLNRSITHDLPAASAPPFHIAIWAQGTEIRYRNIRMLPAGEMMSTGETASARSEPHAPSADARRPAPNRPANQLDPGILINENFRDLAPGSLPDDWISKSKNVGMRQFPKIALALADPNRRDEVALPLVDLSGDFAIDVGFSIPSYFSSVGLQLQGTPGENLYLSVFGDGTVQAQVSRRYSETVKNFRSGESHNLRLERRRGKYNIELNGVVLGQLPVNLGELRFKTIRLNLGPVPQQASRTNNLLSPAVRSNKAGGQRLPTAGARDNESPRIHLFRVSKLEPSRS
jgi:Protein kinase domain/Domain of Unknown Function (DUF1080)